MITQHSIAMSGSICLTASDICFGVAMPYSSTEDGAAQQRRQFILRCLNENRWSSLVNRMLYESRTQWFIVMAARIFILSEENSDETRICTYPGFPF